MYGTVLSQICFQGIPMNYLLRQQMLEQVLITPTRQLWFRSAKNWYESLVNGTVSDQCTPWLLSYFIRYENKLLVRFHQYHTIFGKSHINPIHC